MNQSVQWVVKIDLKESQEAMSLLAELLGFYYRAVLHETGDGALARALTVEYQRMLLEPALAREMIK